MARHKGVDPAMGMSRRRWGSRSGEGRRKVRKRADGDRPAATVHRGVASSGGGEAR